jgi:hypothetical protein
MKALVERNVIWATANPCAQDVTAHGWDDAVAHAQDVLPFPVASASLPLLEHRPLMLRSPTLTILSLPPTRRASTPRLAPPPLIVIEPPLPPIAARMSHAPRLLPTLTAPITGTCVAAAARHITVVVCAQCVIVVINGHHVVACAHG